MTDFADLGAHCAEPYCHQQDFLPFECDRCHKEFCLDHRTYEAHHCPYLNSASYNKQQVIICPLCKSSIHLLPGETEDRAFDRHSHSSDCRPENYGKLRLQKCPVEGCRERLTEVNSYECTKCHTKVCLKHRYEDAHPCREWRARGPSRLFKRGSSGKAAAGMKNSPAVVTSSSSGSKAAGRSSRADQWRCRKCSLINNGNAAACVACGYTPPARQNCAVHVHRKASSSITGPLSCCEYAIEVAWDGRTVRKILDRSVLPGLPEPLPTCVLSPGNDIWSPHEQAKAWNRAKQNAATWQCGICGKVFKSEHYLDLHMESKHMDIANEDGVCLADYCGIFSVCHGTSLISEPRPPPEYSSHVWSSCDENELAALKEKCSLAVESCYDPHSPHRDHRMAYATLYRSHCSMLSCGARFHQHKAVQEAPYPLAGILLALIGITIIIFFSMLICVDCGCGEDILDYLGDKWRRRLVKNRQALRVHVERRTPRGNNSKHRMSTTPRMFNVEGAVYASSTAARKMAIKHGAFTLEGETEKSIRTLDEGKCQATRIAARSAGIETEEKDMKFRMPLPPPPPPVDPGEKLWTAVRMKMTVKDAMTTQLKLDQRGPGLPADRMFHGELKRHFEDLSTLCKDELNRLLKYTVYTTALNNLGDNPEIEQATVKSIKAALNAMLGRLEDYSKVIIDRSLDTLPPAGTSLETEVFKSRLLSVQLDTCVRSHEALQGKLEDTLWRLTNQALSFRHLRMAYQRDLHLLRTKLKGLLVEVEDHMRFREGSGSSAQRLLRSTKEVDEFIRKVSKSDTDVNIFDGDIYMEEETRQLLRQKEEEMKGLFNVERSRFELKIKTLLLENRSKYNNKGIGKCYAYPVASPSYAVLQPPPPPCLAFRTQVEELSDRNHVLVMKVQHLETQVTKLSRGQAVGGASALSIISLQSLLVELRASSNAAAASEILSEGGAPEDGEIVAVSQSELDKVQASFLKLKRQCRLYGDLVAQAKTRLLQGIALAEKNSKVLVPATAARRKLWDTRLSDDLGVIAELLPLTSTGASYCQDPNTDLAIVERVLSECAKEFNALIKEINEEDEACAAATGIKPKPMRFTKADELKQEISVLTTANQVLQRRLAERVKSQEEVQAERDSMTAKLTKLETDLAARTHELNVLKQQTREKDAKLAEVDERLKKAEAAFERERRSSESSAVDLRRAQEAQAQERSKYADDSARKKSILAERERRISVQDDEIQKLQEKMASQEQRLSELKSERKELADSLKQTRSQLRYAHEAADPSMKVMGRGRTLSRAHTSAVDESVDKQDISGGQVKMLRDICAALDLPEIVDELKHRASFDSPVDVSRLIARVIGKLKSRMKGESEAEWLRKLQELEVQSATSYNARLKRERCIMWRSVIRTHSVHGAREIEQVMDTNKSAARHSRTRTGRLRKKPHKAGPTGDLQTLSEPSSSEGEDDDDVRTLFDRTDFGSKYGRLTDYVHARAITWQTALRAQEDPKNRANDVLHQSRRPSATMAAMEVEFLKDKHKSLEKQMEGMKFDIELKDYELRKIREAWIQTNDTCLIYKNAYDMELRKVAALGGEVSQLRSAEVEAAKAAVINTMQTDEAFALAVAERATEAREKMVQLSDEVERDAAELANRRHAMRRIGDAWKAQALDWTDFDFAAALAEEQAVIAGIEAVAAEDGVKEVYEELKAEASDRGEGDRAAQYGEKMEMTGMTSSSSPSPPSSSSSSLSISSSESGGISDGRGGPLRTVAKRELPQTRQASVKKVELTNRLVQELNPQSRDAFWEDAGARERERRMSGIGERGSLDQRRDSRMLMELERLRQEVKDLREDPKSAKKMSISSRGSEGRDERVEELTRELNELKVQNEALQTVQSAQTAAAERHSREEAETKEEIKKLLRQATQGFESPKTLKKISLNKLISEDEDQAQQRGRISQERYKPSSTLLRKTVKIAGTGSSGEEDGHAGSSLRPQEQPLLGARFASDDSSAARRQPSPPIADSQPGPSGRIQASTPSSEPRDGSMTARAKQLHAAGHTTGEAGAAQRARKTSQAHEGVSEGPPLEGLSAERHSVKEGARGRGKWRTRRLVPAGKARTEEPTAAVPRPEPVRVVTEAGLSDEGKEESSEYSGLTSGSSSESGAKASEDPPKVPQQPRRFEATVRSSSSSSWSFGASDAHHAGGEVSPVDGEGDEEVLRGDEVDSDVEVARTSKALETLLLPSRSCGQRVTILPRGTAGGSSETGRTTAAAHGEPGTRAIQMRQAAIAKARRATTMLAQQRSTGSQGSQDPGVVDVESLRDIFHSGSSRSLKRPAEAVPSVECVDSACQTHPSDTAIEVAMDQMSHQLRVYFGRLLEVLQAAGRARVQIRVRPEVTTHYTQTPGSFRCFGMLTRQKIDLEHPGDGQEAGPVKFGYQLAHTDHLPQVLGDFAEELISWLKLNLLQYQHARLNHMKDTDWNTSPLPAESGIDGRRLVEDFVSFLNGALNVKWPGRREQQLGLRAVYRHSAEEVAEVVRTILAVIEPLALGSGVFDDLRKDMLAQQAPPSVTTEREMPRLVDSRGGGFKMNIKGPKRRGEIVSMDTTAGELTTDLGSDGDSGKEDIVPASSATFITIQPEG
ncbi:AN1-type zinc finger protein 2A [Perkinsus olseni]|uniref:AN1-type zinc finger protein 2A n=1 Tax=Perkinsus olseni TaxID=32597 RepID=A0A7J6LEF8_PEROL|nr:AN1-type zinc finger protein 2A [Perkinsus olseni]